MRASTDWRTKLARDLDALQEAYGRLPLPPTQLLDVELILTLFAEYLPGEDPARAWAVLNGYPFPARETLPEASRRAILIARLRLPDPLGRGTWERLFSRYCAADSPYLLYHIHGTTITARTTSIVPERRSAMRATLLTSPNWKRREPRYAEAGIHRFSIDRDAYEVEIPERVAQIGSSAAATLAQNPPKRTALRVTLTDLQTEADWMDHVAPADSVADQDWGSRMRKLQLAVVAETGLASSTELTVDGVLHLIGMVGSGKSTLFTVLAVYLARRGQRVTLVQGDVASLLKAQAVFEVFHQADPQIAAVPLIGRSTRLIHLKRLHVTEAQRVQQLTLYQDHPSYAMLSTVCALDGLRDEVDPIPPGKEPCTTLYPRGEAETPSKRRDCPIMPICPVHNPTHALLTARIWLATPASLLASSPQAPLVPEQLRYAELIMRSSDVVLVDEADLVQIQFDDRFAQMEVLVGHHDSWLDRLYTTVTRQVYRPGRLLIGRNPALDRWLLAHSNAQRAVDCLYRWLRDRADTREWLGKTYFSGQRLLQRVRDEIASYGGDPEHFEHASEEFRSYALGGAAIDPRRASPPEAWIQATHLELFAGASGVALSSLTSWLADTLRWQRLPDAQHLAILAHHTLIALVVSVVDHALQDVIAEWTDAATAIDLDRGSGGLFYAPSADLVRLIPEPPMGAVLGFQYYDQHNTGNGELRFFHIRGIGRALLAHLHDALLLSDGVAGPYVVLTSGTSWAPGSWRYHLAIPPGAVLLPDRIDRTSHTTCRFEPITDPRTSDTSLAISGLPPAERQRNLQTMVQELARPRGPRRRSLFQQELDLLDEHRRRILLIVGNYEEAEIVEKALTSALGGRPGEHVVALISDSQGELHWDQPSDATTEESIPADALLRSQLHRFPTLSATFLVAPLQAVERGHNILVGQEAAIGSVYFLVRPYPVPGDPHTAVQKINSWASEVVPSLSTASLTETGFDFRQQARRQWDEIMPKDKQYSDLTKEERTPILWTELVLVWQCIGRLLRGGADARVHFVDARWAPATAGLSRVTRVDTEATSMLVGFERILREVMTDPDPVRRSLARTLYEPFATALADERLGVNRV